MKKFRFGLQLSDVKDVSELTKWAFKAEELGFDSISLPDHLTEQFSPISALTFLGITNKNITVSSLVLDNDFRHPVIVAREFLTLAKFLGPRVELGVGAGWMKFDYEVSGIKYDPPAIRVERMMEAVLIIKEFFKSPQVNFSGKYYSVTNCPAFPQVEYPPKILIGGGSKKVLSFAVSVADIVNVNANLKAGYIGQEVINELMPEKFDYRFEVIKEAAGSRFSEIDFQCLNFIGFIGSDGIQKLEKLSSSLGIPLDKAKDSPAILAGEVSEVADILEARRQRWGYNYIVVHENVADSFSKVIELLKGR